MIHSLLPVMPPTVMIEIHGEEVPIQCYNVKYLLGGTEKNVRETYIRCTKADGEQEARKIMPRDYFVPTDAKVRYWAQQSTTSLKHKPWNTVFCNRYLDITPFSPNNTIR